MSTSRIRETVKDSIHNNQGQMMYMEATYRYIYWCKTTGPIDSKSNPLNMKRGCILSYLDAPTLEDLILVNTYTTLSRP